LFEIRKKLIVTMKYILFYNNMTGAEDRSPVVPVSPMESGGSTHAFPIIPEKSEPKTAREVVGRKRMREQMASLKTMRRSARIEQRERTTGTGNPTPDPVRPKSLKRRRSAREQTKRKGNPTPTPVKSESTIRRRSAREQTKRKGNSTPTPVKSESTIRRRSARIDQIKQTKYKTAENAVLKDITDKTEKAVRRKSVRVIALPTRRKRATQTKIKRNISKKREYLNILEKINEESKTTKKYFGTIPKDGVSVRVYNMLYSIYYSTQASAFSRIKYPKNKGLLHERLKIEFGLIARHMRSKFKFDDINSPLTLNISLKGENKLNFYLLMWLDMRHDGTISMTFEEFLKSDIVKKFAGTDEVNNIDVVPNSLNNSKIPIFPTEPTNLMKKMIIHDIIDEKCLKPRSNFELKLKDNLVDIFGIQNPMTIPPGMKLQDYAKNPSQDPIYISIDSDSKDAAISSLIQKSTIKDKGGDGYYLKSLITLANRVDPGNLMPQGGLRKEVSTLREVKPKSRQMYNLNDCKFKIGNTSLDLYSCELGKFHQYLNKKYTKPGETRKGAEKGGTTEKLSKFLGDLMQILTVISKPTEIDGRRTTVLGTTDGVMCGIYCFLSFTVLKREPTLLIDRCYAQIPNLQLFGVSDKLLYVGRKGAESHITTHGNGSTRRGSAGSIAQTFQSKLDTVHEDSRNHEFREIFKTIMKLPNNKKSAVEKNLAVLLKSHGIS